MGHGIRVSVAVWVLVWVLGNGGWLGANEAEGVPSVEELSWLVGCWRLDGEGEVVEECWLGARGGLMVGVSRTVKGDGGTFFEFLRIADSETGPVYWASPLGREAVPFRAVEIGRQKVVFENPNHDFPQRILYRLDQEGGLHAAISGLAGDEGGAEWVYEKVSPAWE